MIKIKVRDKLIVGVDARNLEKLQDDQPLVIGLEDVVGAASSRRSSSLIGRPCASSWLTSSRWGSSHSACSTSGETPPLAKFDGLISTRTTGAGQGARCSHVALGIATHLAPGADAQLAGLPSRLPSVASA